MSLKVVSFVSLGTVSYLPSIVTVAVSVAFMRYSVSKNGVTLKTSSRSLKMAPFDRPHATFYWSSVVNIALSCTIFELFDVE